jgi:sec-independent protein translocase protein TatA
MMIVGVIAILVFGKQLPDIARTVGKGWAELQRGLQGIQNEITSAVTGDGQSAPRTVYHEDTDDTEESTAPKFEPPPSPPRAAAPTSPNP